MAITALPANGTTHVSVGVVLYNPIVSRAGDPAEYATFSGLMQAKRRLHVQAKAVAPSPTGPIDLAPYDFLARQGYNLVISTPFIPGLSRAARRFSKTKFVALDGRRSQLTAPVPSNVEGTIFHTEQAAYLAGFVAASMADRRPAPHVVSTVGGRREPQVAAYIAGFRAGARRADPTIKLRNTYSGNFDFPASCAHVANQQIAQGSQVVFAVAGKCGRGALEAAKRRGVFGIGVDIDQSGLGSFILTSAVINWKKAVYDLAERLVHGRLPVGGNLSWDMAHGFVGLGKLSRKVPASLKNQVLRLKAQIEQGKIVVPATLSSH